MPCKECQEYIKKNGITLTKTQLDTWDVIDSCYGRGYVLTEDDIDKLKGDIETIMAGPIWPIKGGGKEVKPEVIDL